MNGNVKYMDYSNGMYRTEYVSSVNKKKNFNIDDITDNNPYYGNLPTTPDGYSDIELPGQKNFANWQTVIPYGRMFNAFNNGNNNLLDLYSKTVISSGRDASSFSTHYDDTQNSIYKNNWDFQNSIPKEDLYTTGSGYQQPNTKEKDTFDNGSLNDDIPVLSPKDLYANGGAFNARKEFPNTSSFLQQPIIKGKDTFDNGSFNDDIPVLSLKDLYANGNNSNLQKEFPKTSSSLQQPIIKEKDTFEDLYNTGSGYQQPIIKEKDTFENDSLNNDILSLSYKDLYANGNNSNVQKEFPKTGGAYKKPIIKEKEISQNGSLNDDIPSLSLKDLYANGNNSNLQKEFPKTSSSLQQPIIKEKDTFEFNNLLLKNKISFKMIH